MSANAMLDAEKTETQTPNPLGRKISMNLSDEDLANSDALRMAIGRPSSRTEVIRRALSLLHWAFVMKSGDELVVQRRGKEVGRMRWADSPLT